MPSQTVTNISASLPSHSVLLALYSISAGLLPDSANPRMAVLARIMNRAAGMPLPDTSAITIASRFWPTKKKS